MKNMELLRTILLLLHLYLILHPLLDAIGLNDTIKNSLRNMEFAVQWRPLTYL
jgi:hypothetical protein